MEKRIERYDSLSFRMCREGILTVEPKKEEKTVDDIAKKQMK